MFTFEKKSITNSYIVVIIWMPMIKKLRADISYWLIHVVTWNSICLYQVIHNFYFSASINNNQNNNNNNNNNIDLNVVSTSNTQTSVNTNNANTISIMLPPPIPVLAGGRRLEAEARLKRLAYSEKRRQMRRNKRSMYE